MNPTVKSSLIGMAIGAGIGILPGLVSALLGSVVGFFRADVGIQDSSSLVIYLGLLIGGAAGSIVGAMASDAQGM
jgi:hypothetical protein